MPKALLDFMGYTFYFYSEEGNGPVHVHVSKGKPSDNAAKFWIKRDSIELERRRNIPQKDLKRIQKYICANRADIIARWYEYFGL